MRGCWPAALSLARRESARQDTANNGARGRRCRLLTSRPFLARVAHHAVSRGAAVGVCPAIVCTNLRALWAEDKLFAPGTRFCASNVQCEAPAARASVLRQWSARERAASWSGDAGNALPPPLLSPPLMESRPYARASGHNGRNACGVNGLAVLVALLLTRD